MIGRLTVVAALVLAGCAGRVPRGAPTVSDVRASAADRLVGAWYTVHPVDSDEAPRLSRVSFGPSDRFASYQAVRTPYRTDGGTLVLNIDPSPLPFSVVGDTLRIQERQQRLVLVRATPGTGLTGGWTVVPEQTTMRGALPEVFEFTPDSLLHIETTEDIGHYRTDGDILAIKTRPSSEESMTFEVRGDTLRLRGEPVDGTMVFARSRP